MCSFLNYSQGEHQVKPNIVFEMKIDLKIFGTYDKKFPYKVSNNCPELLIYSINFMFENFLFICTILIQELSKSKRYMIWLRAFYI